MASNGEMRVSESTVVIVVAVGERRTGMSGYWCLCLGAKRQAELVSRCRSRYTWWGRDRICGGGIGIESLGLGGCRGGGGV